MQEMTKGIKGDTPAVPSSDANVLPSPQSGSKRKKVARTSLTLREKAIVKSFCEQKVAHCKSRGELVPSQEVLRREVVAQFGWSCGRSTLSKIISMDWKLLRGSHEGGEAPRNPDMKRRRRPLFPAFEADLVKYIMAYDIQDGASGATESQLTEANAEEDGVSVENDSSKTALTEALILEEAQRLKQVHGISDDMLVLSVGWLARFKHRHCIHLRKPAGVSNKCMMSLQNGGSNIEQVSMGMWTGALIPPVLPPPQNASEEAIQSEVASRKFEEQQGIEALERDPFDSDSQGKITEHIRLPNVQKNVEITVDEMPEAIAHITMLYFPCEVNGTQVKAFVDSGAQSTVMSSSCAERCGIMRLMGNVGQTVDVDPAMSIRKVHMTPLKIGNEFYNCSFTILDQQDVDFIFGLDMLKRHQCSIDLNKNVLRLHEGERYHEVSFLLEHEIPSSENRGDSAQPPATLGGVPVPPPTSGSSPTSTAPPPAPAEAGAQDVQEKITESVGLEFPEQRV